MSLKRAIATAVSGAEVPAAELEAAFGTIMDGEATSAQIAALLVALRTKGETVAEIVATARALRSRATTAVVSDARTVDTCGTGGDGANTFNISTTAAFVVAGAGVPVAKHGNRAASSTTGSFDVLEELGVRIDLPVEVCARILSEVGIAPFYARTAHPAMRSVAAVRAELGVRTLMNCLGPLLNPVGAKYQLVGVFGPEWVEPLAAALGQLGARRALVVHGSDGLDEITTAGPTQAACWEDGEVRAFEIDPGASGLGIAPPAADDLAGGDATVNAEILRSVLAGETGPRRDIVALNAAGALWVAGAVDSLVDGIALACQSLDSGAAKAKLDDLIRVSGEAAA